MRCSEIRLEIDKSFFEKKSCLRHDEKSTFRPDRLRQVVTGDLVRSVDQLASSRSFDMLGLVTRNAAEGEWYRDLARFSTKPPCHPPKNSTFWPERHHRVTTDDLVSSVHPFALPRGIFCTPWVTRDATEGE